MDVIEAIEKRRTYRLYDQNWTCPKEDLEAIVNAALKSPSACNRQCLDVIAITNREKIDRICEATLRTVKPSAKKALLNRRDEGCKNVITCDAPVMFLLVKNDRAQPMFLDIDGGIMTESIMLTATKFGYGTMCVGIFRQADLTEEIGAKPGEVVMGICMGKVAEGVRLKPREVKAQAIYYN